MQTQCIFSKGKHCFVRYEHTMQVNYRRLKRKQRMKKNDKTNFQLNLSPNAFIIRSSDTILLSERLADQILHKNFSEASCIQ